MNILNEIQKGIKTYKKYKNSNYKFLEKYIDIEKYTFTIAKIESNYNSRAKSEDGFNTFGLFQILPSLIKKVARTYTKNVDNAYNLYYKNADSQTFIFLQLTYLNLRLLLKNNNKLNKNYERIINSIFVDLSKKSDKTIKEELRLAYLHNQGTSALKRQASNYNPSVFYIPNFISIREKITELTKKNISGFVDFIIDANVFNNLKKIKILQLAVKYIKSKLTYLEEMRSQINQIKNNTKSNYLVALENRAKILDLYSRIEDRQKPPAQKPPAQKPPAQKPPAQKPPAQTYKPARKNNDNMLLYVLIGASLLFLGK